MKLARPSHRQLHAQPACRRWIIFGVNSMFWTNTVRPLASTAGRLPFDRHVRSAHSPLGQRDREISHQAHLHPRHFQRRGCRLVHAKFGVIIDTDMIRNAAQTTPAEAGHLMTPAFFRHMALYAVLPSLLIAWSASNTAPSAPR
jgi:hypothetical protein